MLGQSTRPSFRLDGLLSQIIVGCSFGLLLGIASLWSSPYIVLGALLAVILIFAILKRPEIALFGILIATSSIVFEDQLPTIHVGISLNITDFLLLGSLGIIVVRWLIEPEFRVVHTPLDWPLLILYSVTLLSTFIAINNSSVQVVEARRAIRVLSAFLTFFIVTNLIRDRRQLNFLINGILLLGTTVAAAMAVQFLLGNSVKLLPGTVASLWTQGTTYEDITRILPPGLSIINLAFFGIICILVLGNFRALGCLKLVQCSLLGMALLVTFLRSFWAVIIIVLFLLVVIVRGVDRQKLIGWGLVVIFSAGMTVILLMMFSSPSSRAMKLVNASIDRLSTLARSETFQGQDSSLNWRMRENQYAFAAIMQHPAIGLGMTAMYRPYDPRLFIPGSGTYFRTYIHNGHLWILLQSGLLGYFSLMWLSLAFLIRGFRYWRSIVDSRMRAVMLGFSLFYLAALMEAVFFPLFKEWSWIPVIGTIMGVNEVILRLNPNTDARPPGMQISR
jgi:hypothetical protein